MSNNPKKNTFKYYWGTPKNAYANKKTCLRQQLPTLKVYRFSECNNGSVGMDWGRQNRKENDKEWIIAKYIVSVYEDNIKCI
jgi:hypothetical protein